jgi:hypothetical protein
VSLELGGKSPNIIFDDCDLDAAVAGAVSGIFAATGQTCIAGSRVLVQNSIKETFTQRLVELGRTARKGDPMLPDTNIGPVTTAPQYQKILDYIDIARAEGARCVREEVFGPVLSILGFEDEDEAIRLANDTIYGLAAGVWTSNIGRVEGRHRLGEHLPRRQLHDAVRRHEALGPGTRERHRGDPGIPGNQERVDFHGAGRTGQSIHPALSRTLPGLPPRRPGVRHARRRGPWRMPDDGWPRPVDVRMPGVRDRR